MYLIPTNSFLVTTIFKPATESVAVTLCILAVSRIVPTLEVCGYPLPRGPAQQGTLSVLPTPRLVLNKKLLLHSQFLTVSTIRYPTCAGIQTFFVWTRKGLQCPVAQATVARVERERGRSLSMAGTARLTDRDEHRGHRWSDQTVDDRDTTSSTTF